jgi:hypothetical protein
VTDVGEKTPKPAKLRGIAARQWGTVILAVSVLWIAAGAGVVGMVLTGSEAALYTAFGWVLGMVLILVLIAVQRATERREVRAGYTTLMNRHQNLWQLHPRTGAALRAPGERFLER